MSKRTDFIELGLSGDDVIVDNSDFFVGGDCVTVASFKNMEDGEGYKKFHEKTYDGAVDFCAGITGILTALKFTKFKMVGYSELRDSIKILDLENSIIKTKIRLIINGFKADLSDLKDLYNEAV